MFSNITVGLAFVAGVLSFISPCVLPLIPAYIGYLGGRATAQNATPTITSATQSSVMQLRRTAGLGLVIHGLFFVIGFSFIFVSFGLLANISLRFLGIYAFDLKSFIAHFGGLLIVFFGLHVMGVIGWLLTTLIQRIHWDLWGSIGAFINRLLEHVQSILYRDTRHHVNNQGISGYAGSAFMGVVFAAGWTPCIGPIYGAILTMAANANNESIGQAATLLSAYSLGLGLPFLLTAAALDRMRGLLKRLQRQMRMIAVSSGIFLMVIGYLVFTDQLAALAQPSTGLADFSVNLENCVYLTSQGKIELAEFNTCMSLVQEQGR